MLGREALLTMSLLIGTFAEIHQKWSALGVMQINFVVRVGKGGTG